MTDKNKLNMDDLDDEAQDVTGGAGEDVTGGFFGGKRKAKSYAGAVKSAPSAPMNAKSTAMPTKGTGPIKARR